MSHEAESTLALWARALTNEVLARHLDDLADDIRLYKRGQREALLLEAARRLAKLK